METELEQMMQNDGVDFVSDLTDQGFEKAVLHSPDIVLVEFWAPWCTSCKTLKPVLEQIAEQYVTRVRVYKMNVDEETEIASQYGIRGLPTVLLFKRGELISRIVGAQSLRTYVRAFEKEIGE